MECNKDEAIRAKNIAEKKLQDKDYAAACRFALKAQKLNPKVESISQLLTVSEVLVHCSAEFNSRDCFSILQVDQTADDVLIKKQFRKLALLLHPDRNKFPGAEAAFRLIHEAHRVLLDNYNFGGTCPKPVFSHSSPSSGNVGVVRESTTTPPQNSSTGDDHDAEFRARVVRQEAQQQLHGKRNFVVLFLPRQCVTMVF